MKLVIIGASYKFVKRVINDFILSGEFEDADIAVVDIVREPIDIVVNAAKAIIAGSGSNIRIFGTVCREEALTGADFVLVSISVGGLEAMEKDRYVIRKYGVPLGKENTTGPTALGESLRIIPVMLEITRDMERICPEAWMINVSNPMAASVQAVAAYSRIKVLGLCHGSADGIKTIARIYGAASEDVEVNFIGVNHMTFAKDIRVGGRDVMATFIDDFNRVPKEAIPYHDRKSIEFFRLYGYFPLVGDGYLPAFLPHLLEDKPGEYTKAAETRESLKKLLLDIGSSRRMDFAPTNMSGENIHGIILSLYYGKKDTHIVNIPNKGYIVELRQGSVIEAPATIYKNTLEGLFTENGVHSPYMTAAISTLNVVNDLIVEAAVTGSREKAYHAMILDPATRNSDVLERVPSLVDELFEANRAYIPKFEERR